MKGRISPSIRPGLGLLFCALGGLLLLTALYAAPARAGDPFSDATGAGVAKMTDLYEKMKEMEEKVPPPLDPNDPGSPPDYNPPGQPEVPVSCGENNDCWNCYNDANKKLEKLRGNFEKLRLVYKETDDFTKAAMAFGDGAAGATGFAALEWNAQRGKIKKSFKTFEEAYRKKYNELLDKLKAALQEVAKCEQKYFGEKDWYARYGYMFHSFIALHYQK